MSLIQPAMLEKQKFTSGHIRSRSYNELVSKFSSIANQTANSTTKPKVFGKRHLDGAISSESKRSRTAPPSPPSPPYEAASPVPATKSQSPFMVIKPTKYSRSLRSRSLSPNRRFFNPISPSHSPKSSPVTTPEKSNKSQQEQNGRVRLPGISSVLNSALPKHNKLKPIAPTVLLDYFDTYKPNDENWRYELLDTINRGSKHFNLDQYKYLNQPTKQVPSPSSHRMGSLALFKPSFDSRISKKIAHPPKLPSINHIHHERKINFPYESSYTYLNKTYLKDVEKYPEYLELAQSLIQLSQPKLKPMTPPSPEIYSEHPFERHDLPSLPRPNHYLMPFTPAAVPPPITTTAPAPHYYLPPQGAFTSPNSSGATRLPSISQPTHYNGFAPPSRRQSYETAQPQTQPQTQLQPPVMLTPTIDQTPPQVHNHKFIPISPQSSKSKSRSELLKSPPKPQLHNPRVCISCGSEQSPCWRPSWSVKEGQLCNSCGLRYKKTSARCLNKNCKKIPAKGEWSLMQSKGKMAFDDGVVGHSCLECGWRVEVKKS